MRICIGFAALAFAPAILCAPAPDVTLTGDWKIKVSIREPRSIETNLTVEPPRLLSVTAEKYNSLPVFNGKAAGWVKGAQLRGVKAQETTTPYLLVEDSVVVRAGALDNSEVLRKGADYDVDATWGTIGRLAEGKIKEGQPVYVSYTHAQLRLDSVVLAKDGNVVLRGGTPQAAAPLPPAVSEGERRLANIWLPGRVARLAPENLFPILETSYPESAKPSPTPAEKLIPKAFQKLRNGEPLRILAWGDSVTVGTFVPNPEREQWQEQVVSRLRDRLPAAKITLLTAAWGGRC